MYAINKLYNCGIFQGAARHRHYFEGWYFKHVDKGEQNELSVIPGVSIKENESNSHAFIQILDGRTYKTYYIRYGIEEFSFSKRNFELTIGNNRFSDKGIKLDIVHEDITLQGSLTYSKLIHWPSGITSPNSMGWYAYIPIMECYHGVLSLQHNILGQIKLNDRMIDFDGGIGYMEKDWGTSFPSSWIWLQSNHFDIANTSLMLSIAKIPWNQRSFVGLLSGLWYEGKVYRFATYTMSIKLHNKKTDRIILETKAHCCGMEIAGNIQELITQP